MSSRGLQASKVTYHELLNAMVKNRDIKGTWRLVDEMREGPFVAWRHQHLFFPDEEGCRLRDEIDYTPPLGWLGRIAAPVAIDRRLRRMFDFRHRVTRDAVVGTSVG